MRTRRPARHAPRSSARRRASGSTCATSWCRTCPTSRRACCTRSGSTPMPHHGRRGKRRTHSAAAGWCRRRHCSPVSSRAPRSWACARATPAMWRSPPISRHACCGPAARRRPRRHDLDRRAGVDRRGAGAHLPRPHRLPRTRVAHDHARRHHALPLERVAGERRADGGGPRPGVAHGPGCVPARGAAGVHARTAARARRDRARALPRRRACATRPGRAGRQLRRRRCVGVAGRAHDRRARRRGRRGHGRPGRAHARRHHRQRELARAPLHRSGAAVARAGRARPAALRRLPRRQRRARTVGRAPRLRRRSRRADPRGRAARRADRCHRTARRRSCPFRHDRTPPGLPRAPGRAGPGPDTGRAARGHGRVTAPASSRPRAGRSSACAPGPTGAAGSRYGRRRSGPAGDCSAIRAHPCGLSTFPAAASRTWATAAAGSRCTVPGPTRS